MTRAIDVFRAAVAPLTRTRTWRRFVVPVLPSIERLLGRLSGGRAQLTAFIVPSLMLHTVGAKSGEPRDAPLMYTPDGKGRAIVAGTNWAGAKHPAWTAKSAGASRRRDHGPWPPHGRPRDADPR